MTETIPMIPDQTPDKYPDEGCRADLALLHLEKGPNVTVTPAKHGSLKRNSPPPLLPLAEQLNNGLILSNATTTATVSIECVPPTSNGVPKKVINLSPSMHRKAINSLSHLPKRPPVDIEFLELSYFVKSKGYTQILKGINGKFRSGDLTAIMGPSGAGKSTLMNILAGYKTKHLSGQVLINGKPRNLRRFRKMSCYIMQDDCLLPHLTVKESMWVSANLKLDKDITHSARKLVIEEIIEALGLVNSVDTLVGQLSGGQRKRLAIALELVNNPPVMFFDEPTSGLDSLTCCQCISLLKSLARGGRTIIFTIHQPSARIFEMFDYLYTLTDGQCLYRGNVFGLIPFFKSVGLQCPSYHNPADFVIEVGSGDHGEEATTKCIEYMQSEAADIWSKTITNDISKDSSLTSIISSPTIDASPTKNKKHTIIATHLADSNDSMAGQKKGFPTSTFRQFWILLKRTFISTARDKTLTLMRLVAHLLVGAIIGVIYFDIGNDASKTFSNMGCLFFLVMFTMFSALMPTILTFPTEMGVFVREYLNYWYSAKAYYLAKTVADIPFQTAFTSIYVVMVYFMSGQPYDVTRFFMVINVCVLTSLVAQSIGLLCGAAMDLETATFIGPIVSIPMILFAGFFVNFNTLNKYLQWLPFSSYIRYGFEGTMIAIYGYERPDLECNEIYCPFKRPTRILEERNMENALYWVDVLALLGFFIVLRIIVYYVLKLKLRSLR